MEEKVDKILKIQEKNIQNNKQVQGLILLDDVQVHAKSKKLIDLACLGRHFKITVIMSVQYPKQLCSSSIRSNIDYLFWSDLGEIAIKAVYECIHVKYNFREFKDFVNQNNHSYQFILYDSRTQNREERLKVVKAKELKNIKLT